MNLNKYLEKNKIDFIDYVAKLYLSDAVKAKEIAKSVSQLAKYLHLISDSNLQQFYIDEISKEYKIGKKQLFTAINIAERSQKIEVRKFHKKKEVDKTKIVDYLTPIATNSEDETTDLEEYRFFKRNGMYWTMSYDGKGTYDISDFLMEFLYLIKDDSNNATRIIKVQEQCGNILIGEILSSQFSISGFNQFLMNLEGAYLFTGDQKNLNKIIQYERKFNEKYADRIAILGYNVEGDFMAFSNKYINSDNELCDYNDLGFFPSKGKLFYNPFANTHLGVRKEFEDMKKYTYEAPESPIKLSIWIKQIVAAYGKQAYIGLAFTFASLNRHTVLKANNNQLTMLFLRGMKGSGKTTFAQSFSALVGIKKKPTVMSGSSTPKGLFATLSQFNNFIIPLDEYKNTLHIDFIEFLKNLYDGYSRIIKANDQLSNTTITHPVCNAFILMGQDLPTKDIALFERTFLLDFWDTNRPNEVAKAHFELMQWEDNGLSNIVLELFKFRNNFSAKYKKYFDQIFFELKKETTITDRMIQNCTQIITSFKILSESTPIDISVDEFKAYVLECVRIQDDLIQSSDETAKFWKITYQLMNNQVTKEFDGHQEVIRSASLIEHKHYKRFSYDGHDVLGIKFHEVWSEYSKEHQRLYHSIGLGEENMKGYLTAGISFIHFEKDGKTKNTVNVKLKHYGSGNSTPVYMFDQQILNGSYFQDYSDCGDIYTDKAEVTDNEIIKSAYKNDKDNDLPFYRK